MMDDETPERWLERQMENAVHIAIKTANVVVEQASKERGGRRQDGSPMAAETVVEKSWKHLSQEWTPRQWAQNVVKALVHSSLDQDAERFVLDVQQDWFANAVPMPIGSASRLGAEDLGWLLPQLDQALEEEFTGQLRARLDQAGVAWVKEERQASALVENSDDLQMDPRGDRVFGAVADGHVEAAEQASEELTTLRSKCNAMSRIHGRETALAASVMAAGHPEGIRGMLSKVSNALSFQHAPKSLAHVGRGISRG